MIAAGMIAAGVAVTAAVMTVFMMVMAAVKIGPDMEIARDIGCRRPGDIAFRTADDLDPGGGEGVDGAGTDAAADQDIDLVFGEKRGQRAVSGIARRENAFPGDFAVRDLKHRKTGRVAEMLKDVVIFTGDCDFHGATPCFPNLMPCGSMCIWRAKVAPS